VVNVGTTDVLLYANIVLCRLNNVCVIILPSGVSEVRSVAATVGSLVLEVIPIVQEQIEALDLSVLSEVE